MVTPTIDEGLPCCKEDGLAVMHWWGKCRKSHASNAGCETRFTAIGLSECLTNAGVRFHQFATEGSADTYLLMHRNDSLELHRYLSSVNGGKVYLLTSRGISKRKLTDAALFSGVGIHLADVNCFVLLCDETEFGWWITKYRPAPVRRVWPPNAPGGHFAAGRFTNDQGIVFLPSQHNFTIPSRAECARPRAIDAVYTWVQSDDPRWQLKKFLHGGSTAIRSADNPLRYQSRNELMYSMRSVRDFAPWIRNIFVVTDEQTPSWLLEIDGVRVVDHKEIFPDQRYLPVFNSHAIEANLHRINGLSEHFIYFNDDMFLGRPVSPRDFFTRSGKSKIYPSPIQLIDPAVPEEKRVPTDYAGYNMQSLFLREFGATPVRKMKHIPYAIRRSVMQELWDRFPEEVERTISSKLRNQTDIAFPSMLYHYYAWVTGRAETQGQGKTSYVYFDLGKANASEMVDRILADPPHFFCPNVTYHEENAPEEQAFLLERLFSLYPKPAPWEQYDCETISDE